MPGGASGDQFRSLRDWLSREGELRGRIGLVEGKAVPGTLSSGIVEAITVGIGSGGAITVLVSGIISWLRQVAGQRREPVPAKVTLVLPDGGTVTLETAIMQELTQAELRDLVAHFAGLVSAGMQGIDGTANPTADAE